MIFTRLNKIETRETKNGGSWLEGDLFKIYEPFPETERVYFRLDNISFFRSRPIGLHGFNRYRVNYIRHLSKASLPYFWSLSRDDVQLILSLTDVDLSE